ncbi:hypothetical protein ACA910_017069 [Epithemia clementina (nom. ined.)]
MRFGARRRLFHGAFGGLVLAAIGGGGGVDGWGKLGHQAIANVAWDLMNTATKEAVHGILLGSAEPLVHAICDEPCSPLAYVADWADTARYSKEYSWSGPLHYVDIQDQLLPDSCQSTTTATVAQMIWNATDWLPECNFVPSRDCADQQCVTGSILNYTLQLKISTSVQDDDSNNNNNMEDNIDARQQKVALMFLAHFVGDIHQPLHVSRESDKGGNEISVQLQNWTTSSSSSSLFTGERHARNLRGRALTAYSGLHSSRHGLNLHSVWDGSIIDTFLEQGSKTETPLHFPSPFSYQNHENRTMLELEMHRIIQEAQGTGSAWSLWMACPHGQVDACVTAWAQESWLLAQEHAYVYGNGSQIAPGDALPVDYYQRNLPIVLNRLSVAAVRLAATLQAVFATKKR